jgi:hypothetical protein
MAAEATAGAAWVVVAATSEAVEVVSTVVADRMAADTGADTAVAEPTAVAPTAAQVILADTRGAAPMAADTVRAVRPLLAPGRGKVAVAPATLLLAGTALTVVHPPDLGPQALLAGRVTHRLEPTQAAQTSLLIQWPPMVTGTPSDPIQAWLPMHTQPAPLRSITPHS